MRRMWSEKFSEGIFRMLMLLALATKRATNANPRLSCVCSLAECENVNEGDCPNGAGTVWDSCKCCRICARVENEPCGGPFGFSGSCAAGLECVVSDFFSQNAVGVCTRIFNKDISCQNPKLLSGCNIVDRSCRCEHSESCSEESPFTFKSRQECQINLNAILTLNQETDEDGDGGVDDEGETSVDCPPDSVLTASGICECDHEKCSSESIVCEHGLVKTLIRKGSNMSGECCDLYKCLSGSANNCTDVKCPEIPPCPPDSYRLPSHKSVDDCCAISQGCHCLPSCEPFSCNSDNPDLTPFLVTEATGKPGRCCPLYSCEKPTSPTENSDEGQEEFRGCITNQNVFIKNGMNWTSSDYCTRCTCQDGQAVCHTSACAPCPQKPIKVPGQCCPRCDDTLEQPAHCPSLPNCTQPCPNGNVKDDDGCITCQCRRNCPPNCVYQVDRNGDTTCKCSNERGKDSAATCQPLLNCKINCPFGYQKDDRNCDTCECKNCSKQCSQGYQTDSAGYPMCNCKPWYLPPEKVKNGTPCKTEMNVIRDDGETWFDGCRQCSCISGKEMCSLIRCFPFSCSNPIVNSTSSCCPFCPDDPIANRAMNHMVCPSPAGDIMLEGESLWLDECTHCVCHNGLALCRAKDCPPTPCSNPRPPLDGKCCSTCPISNEINVENEFLNSFSAPDARCNSSQTSIAVWREGSCVSCQCEEGRKRCFTELCDKFNKCKRWLTIKGKCCPLCLDKSDKYKFTETCVYGNITYENGQDWPVDACTRCRCNQGQVTCTEKVCSQSCTNAIREPGHCCPSCRDEVTSDFQSMQEVFYIAVLLVVIGVSVGLVVCVTRHWRYKKQQIRLRNLSCVPPQYHQYKYIPSSPYDAMNTEKIVSSEKTSLAPV